MNVNYRETEMGIEAAIKLVCQDAWKRDGISPTVNSMMEFMLMSILPSLVIELEKRLDEERALVTELLTRVEDLEAKYMPPVFGEKTDGKVRRVQKSQRN